MMFVGDGCGTMSPSGLIPISNRLTRITLFTLAVSSRGLRLRLTPLGRVLCLMVMA